MRDKINQQFSIMLGQGIIPIIEEITSLGTLTIEISRDAYGICFDYSFEDDFDYSKKPYFDGTIQKRNGVHYVSWAEIDRSFTCLDTVLQFIHDNVMDGLISTYDLHI